MKRRIGQMNELLGHDVAGTVTRVFVGVGADDAPAVTAKFRDASNGETANGSLHRHICNVRSATPWR
jgi:hypothetical protein